MKVWTTPTHVAVHDAGQLDIIERSTGNTLVLQCTDKAASTLLAGDTSAWIASLLRAYRNTPMMQGMYKPAKLALTYPLTEQVQS